MSLYYNTKFNKYARDDAPFEMDGIQYAGNWFQLVSKQDIVNAGFVLVIESNQRADDRFYWVSEQLDKAVLTYVNTPKDLQALKKTWKEQINNIVYTTLAPSDYMPARSFETGEPMNEAWKTYRAEVRAYATSVKASIDACTTVDELANIVTSMEWPHDPNYVPPVESPAESV